MNTKIIGIKQLHKDLKKISEETLCGRSFIVVKNSKPVFKIEPLECERSKKYNLNDFKKLQFRSRDKKMSGKADEIVYS